jgi:large subunit ribosomal protein L10
LSCSGEDDSNTRSFGTYSQKRLFGESLPKGMRGKDFFWKGGDITLAISKERKNELIDYYVGLMNRSKGLILTEYTGLTMKQIDELRRKVRETGGEYHVVKNTLGKIAFESNERQVSEGFFEGSTAIAFAFDDAASMAKTILDFNKTIELVKIKGGYLEKQMISAEQVRALSELPALPVIRAQLLGTLLAPAGKLVRTLAEPARALAAVLQAYAEKDAAPQQAEQTA